MYRRRHTNIHNFCCVRCATRYTSCHYHMYNLSWCVFTFIYRQRSLHGVPIRTMMMMLAADDQSLKPDVVFTFSSFSSSSSTSSCLSSAAESARRWCFWAQVAHWLLRKVQLMLSYRPSDALYWEMDDDNREYRQLKHGVKLRYFTTYFKLQANHCSPYCPVALNTR